MVNGQKFSSFIDELSTYTKMENIWFNTCGTWQNCNQSTIHSFLTECLDYNLDPQYCMSWVEKHKSEIPNWNAVSVASLGWVNQHTSTGSSYSIADVELS